MTLSSVSFNQSESKDVIKNLLQKHKLLISTTEPRLKSLRVGGETEARPIRGLVGPVSQRLSRFS